MKSKKKNLMGLVIVTVIILSSVSIIGQTNSVLSITDNSASKNQSLPIIYLTGDTQISDTLSNMMANFNANYSSSYGFNVKFEVAGGFSGFPDHQVYVDDFKAHTTVLDVLVMDDTWLPEFASHGWILPLNDVFNASNQLQFFQSDIASATYNGKIYSVPWFTDSGMLYYRSDILHYAFTNGIIPADRPPQTWSELTNWTLAMLQDQSLVSKFNITSGFVWQGRIYEGLLYDLMEYLGATGTYSYLSGNQANAVFENSSGLQDALRYMKSLITTGVSPVAVLNYEEELSSAVWNAGNAIFMRNWPYVYPLSLNSAQLNGSLVSGADHNVQQFNITIMPAENSSVVNPRPSCSGDWQLAVSAYSKYPNDAKKFIMWLTASKQQQTYFLGSSDKYDLGYLPTLKAVYNSPSVLHSNQSYVHNFLPIFESSISQPITTDFLNISIDLARVINFYLGGKITLENAIKNMTTIVNSLSNQNSLFGPLNSSLVYTVGGIVIIASGIFVIVEYRKFRKEKFNISFRSYLKYTIRRKKPLNEQELRDETIQKLEDIISENSK